MRFMLKLVESVRRRSSTHIVSIEIGEFMDEFSTRHRLFVANYFSGKVKELCFQLAIIVAGCDQSLNLFKNEKEVSAVNSRAVIYGFSAFTNVIQALKDAVKTVTNKQLHWSAIEGLRHGSFMRNARNAATHDGNPIISGWADGLYFVPAKIIRLDGNAQIVETPAPAEDVRTICAEFTNDFCQLLRDKLISAQSVSHLKGSLFNISDLDATFESIIIPEFARKLFAQDREAIKAALKEIKHDPISAAVNELDDAIKYSNSIMGV